MAATQKESISLYVEYIHRIAHLATADRDYGSLELVAHLFAIAHQLSVDDNDLDGGSLGHIIQSLEHLQGLLLALPKTLSPKELYWRLIEAMDAVENVSCQSKDEGYSAEPVEIDSFGSGSHRLTGRVSYWIRPPSAFRAWRLELLEAARDAGKHTSREPLEEPARHLKRLVCHWMKGKIEVSLAHPADSGAPLFRSSGSWIEDGEPFRIALCPLDARAHPKFEMVKNDTRFLVHQAAPMVVKPGFSVPEQLQVILEACRKTGVHILVLPELTVDLEAREWLSRHLSESPENLPYGVVAGSFHIGASLPRNESVFLGHTGEVLLSHHKRGRFSVSGHEVEDLCKRGFFHDEAWILSRLAQLPADIDEHIDPGKGLSLLETDLGQMAVLICADGIDEQDRPELHQEIASLRPDFVFLPSMTPKTARFDELASRLERLGVSTLFVNAACVCPSTETLAAFCLGIHEDQDGPATHVRWCGDCLQQWDRKRKPEGWAEIGDRGGAVSWLESGGGQKLGMVVDLSAYRTRNTRRNATSI